MLRFDLDSEGTVRRSDVKIGRGAYICSDGNCAEVAAKKNALARSFKRKVNPEVYKQIDN